jgi:protein-L-isoaspartate(D-aspartate) O-methyltransferase
MTAISVKHPKDKAGDTFTMPMKKPFKLSVWVILLTAFAGLAAARAPDRADEREAMVEEQIVAREVRDRRVVAAMRRVPRHRFVPPDMAQRAYQDRPLPIGENQTISQPYIVALMSELLGLKGPEKVLEIGTGSGYQAAVLAELSKDVYSIEIIPALAERARRTLESLGYSHVRVKTGDGYAGWPDHAPYDAIIVTCAPNDVPQALQDQLKEGGRLVIPVGSWPNQTLYLMEKQKGKLVRHPVIPVVFVPMTGESGR